VVAESMLWVVLSSSKVYRLSGVLARARRMRDLLADCWRES
jgi:hypothetical protein